MIEYEEVDWEARSDLWDKYYKPDTNDWGVATRESPVRGVVGLAVITVSALVVGAWMGGILGVFSLGLFMIAYGEARNHWKVRFGIK